MNYAVAIFAKPPLPGVSKTRLGASIGHDLAARLAAAFLADTVDTVRTVGELKPFIATTDCQANHGVDVPLLDQGTGELGARIERVMRALLLEHDGVFAIGADTPHLTSDTLREATAALRKNQAVFGPAEDGGFYLLGLTACPEGMLLGLPWSARETAEATLAALARCHMRPALLAPERDIDTLDDLEHVLGRPGAKHSKLVWSTRSG